MQDWLAEHNIARVGMESTSDYWRPVFYLLEQRFDCWLLNARHMRAVPGRKTDMTDAEWICDLVALGLVRPSFVPPPPIRRLRDLTRRRAILLAERTREKQRMEKLLEDAGVKLSVVATDIFGKSGRAMLDALITGERDPKVLAELALGRLRKKIPALAEALVGRFDDHHAFLARMICDHIDTISAMVAELTARIESEIEPYRGEVELLDSLPGVDTRTAEVIIAEAGRRGALLRRAPLRTVHATRRRTRLKQAAGALRVVVLASCVCGLGARAGRRRVSSGFGSCPACRARHGGRGSRRRLPAGPRSTTSVPIPVETGVAGRW